MSRLTAFSYEFHLNTFLLAGPLLLLLGACATTPEPNRSPAPVVDQSIDTRIPVAPLPPPVEVQPLERPEPIVSTEEQAEQVAIQPVYESPAPAVAPGPASSEQILRQGNQPVVALLDSAADYVDSGELDKAAAALERALRLEPRNASIWHDLGQIRLHQGEYQQAEDLATKSNSLSDSGALQARNWRLIAIARRAAGDRAGADAAEAQALVAER